MEASPSPANAPIPAFVPTFSSRIPDPPPEAEVFTSFKSLPPRPQGDYYVKIAAGRTNKYYVTHDRLGRMYVRLMRKEAQTYTPEVLGVTAEVLGGMDIKGIAFSDKLITVETEYSWILPTVKVSYKWTDNTSGCYYYPEHECPNNALLNFINGKTPTGTEWSQNYDKGHLIFSGTLETWGTWNSKYVGVNYSSYYNVSDNVTFQCGGTRAHTGEFVHTGANGYNHKDHSITARHDDAVTRVFWVLPSI